MAAGNQWKHPEFTFVHVTCYPETMYFCSSVRTVALLLRCSVAPFLRSSVPPFLCSSVPLFLCSSVPLFLRSSVPLFLCSFVSLFLCSSVPMFLCSFHRSSVSLLLFSFLPTPTSWISAVIVTKEYYTDNAKPYSIYFTTIKKKC